MKTTLNRLIFPLLATLGAASLPGTAVAQMEVALKPHTAIYKVRISIASGTLTTEVSETGEGFQVRSVIQPRGLAGLLFNGVIEENSRFIVSGDGVTPAHYWSNDELSSEPKRMDFRFDTDRAAVTGTINDEPFEFALEQEAHDRVSIQYELMRNLLTGEDSGEYALLDGDELKSIVVSNIGRKTIKVPYGRFDAVGIQHQADGSSRVTTLWCAEELGYLPVLIEQSRKGKTRVKAELAEYIEGNPVATPES